MRSTRPSPQDLAAIVLQSTDFADLFQRTEFIGRIADSDRRIVATVQRARSESQTAEKRLRRLTLEQERATDRVLARREEINSVRANLVRSKEGFERTRSAKRDLLARTRVDQRTLESEVVGLRSQQAKVRRALQRAQIANAPGLTSAPVPSRPAAPVRSGGGDFVWPVNGPITSRFCERRSYESCHPGMDIAAAEGTPIRAPSAGKVVLMQSVAASAGYGNYACVQHTATLSSCFAHQSRFGTALGATVRQRQVIGYVGNTGRSFGAHLHFEVRVNGSVVNPLNYL